MCSGRVGGDVSWGPMGAKGRKDVNLVYIIYTVQIYKSNLCNG